MAVAVAAASLAATAFALTAALLSLAWSTDQYDRVAISWVLLAAFYSLALQVLIETTIRRRIRIAWPDLQIPAD
jgi:hypothetical protein